MKNILSLFVFTFLTFFTTIAQNVSELPDYVLPSPQAYQITKYGDIPVNETAGKISPSVPLYNYKAGALNLPISLSYSGNGVKVSDLPTWTGNNWTLNAGGVITRVVKDLPDETSMPRFFYSQEQLTGLLIDPLNINSNIKNLITNTDAFDTEVDLFNFSFGGYSGSFFLEIELVEPVVNGVLTKEITAHLINKNSDLKIEVLGVFNESSNSLYEFLITTPEGVKYSFGGVSIDGFSTTEETQFVDRSSSQPIFGKRAKTAFHLTQIENHLGDQIFFEYHTKDQYEVLSFKNQTLTKDITISGSQSTITCQPTPPSTGGISSVKKVKNITYNGKYLKRILSSSGTDVIFNSAEVTTSNQYYRVLKNVDFNTKIVDLEYWPNEDLLETSQNKDRFFLTKVISRNSNQTAIANYYSFEYDDLASVPNIDSFAQDYFGYYNGVNSNTNLLPRDHSKFLNIHLPGILSSPFYEKLQFAGYGDLLADRKPNFNYATKGLLKRIYYPTGGYTEFEYAPAELNESIATRHLQIHSNMGQATPAWTPDDDFTDTVAISDNYFIDENTLGENVFISQKVRFDGNITTLGASGLDYHDYVYLKITDITTGVITTEKYNFPSTVTTAENTQTSFPFTFSSLLLKDHGYSFTLGFGDSSSGSGGEINSTNTQYFSNTPMVAKLSFRFIDGYDQTNGSGIRIKRVKDYTKDNNLANTRRYYYKKAIEINNGIRENKVNIYAPFFISISQQRETCDAGVGDGIQIKDFYLATLNSNASALNFPNSDAISYYKDVTISYGGDNFENGGIEKNFRVIPDAYPFDFSNFISATIPEYSLLKASLIANSKNKTNLGAFNGTLEKTATYINNAGDLYKQSQTQYEYDYLLNYAVSNIHGFKIFDNSLDVANQTSLYDLYIGLYDTYSSIPILKSSLQKTYINPIPLSAYIASEIYGQGWQVQDADGDGVVNGLDLDFIQPDVFASWTAEEIEANAELNSKKVVEETEHTYSPFITTQPISTKTKKSDGQTMKSYNFYPIPEHISVLNNLTVNETDAYTSLNTENRINSPIQVATSIIDENELEKVLSTVRSTYTIEDINPDPSIDNTQTLLKKVQNTKGGDVLNLEDRIEYVSYDVFGNPREIKRTDGSSVLYFWSSRRNPITKIVNATFLQYQNATSGTGIEISENTTTVQFTTLADLMPNSQILKYNYIPGTDYIDKVTDSRGSFITYHYDEFYRLDHVKDKDGNILSKNEYNYETQN